MFAWIVAAAVTTSTTAMTVTASTAAAPKTHPVESRWAAVINGFVELDTIFDTTQSFGDFAGNAVIAHEGSYAAEHRRFTIGVRHSRFGLRVTAPETHAVKASAQLEVDLLGAYPLGTNESAVFASPFLRLRHANLKLETPFVDVLAGQAWALFGWQPTFHPNTVQIQGVPGEAFSRSPQLRVSKTLDADELRVELAIAAVRPPERDAAVPDGQAGAKLSWKGWRGTRTIGAVLKEVDPIALGISGVARRFVVPELSATPKQQRTAAGWGVSIDAFVPILPATPEHRGNALTLTAAFVKGEGIADLFTGLTGGATLPVTANGTPYVAGIDPGLVGFDANGALVPIEWRSFIGGFQYYFPDDGDVWVSGTYAWMSSSNLSTALSPASPGRMFRTSHFAALSLFAELLAPVRVGLEGAFFRQSLLDGSEATNGRAQLSVYYFL